MTTVTLSRAEYQKLLKLMNKRPEVCDEWLRHQHYWRGSGLILDNPSDVLLAALKEVGKPNTR